jgi:betaine-aldehyde dehydrogenase
MSELPLENRNFIAGQWCAPAGGKSLTIINPADKGMIGELLIADPDLVKSAVAAAKSAFPSWSKLSGKDRGTYLSRMADAIRSDMLRMVGIQQLNSGKPRQEAINDIADAAACLDYFAGVAAQLDQKQGEDAPYSNERIGTQFYYHAVGVAALILPWNFPFKICAWKLAPALAAGSTVVVKPSELTPFIENEWGRIATQAGLPAGVLNIVHGQGHDVGAALVDNPDVAKVSFTGSTKVGSSIMASAARDIKRIGLELGGKSSIIVFDNADLELAARLVMEGIFYNCGQCCNATSRLLVQEGIKDRLLELLRERTAELVIDGPKNDAADMGPLMSQAQFEKVTGYFDIAASERLNVVSGGTVHKRSDGYFVEPTIYSDVPQDSRLWNEEIFGPVLAVRTFASADDAVAQANACDYGLAATVVSADAQQANRTAAQLEAGHIYVNTSVAILPETMWGGFKKSGLGRELGRWGLEGFLEPKAVTFAK